ncbi:hypothetical protein BJ166DRAFT_27486 [Pestalotiopsis sp. NC0098]|nr:hypothetical protein BJ166DRAFT_27486 [Pestalotiopsis sp. NC0098]
MYSPLPVYTVPKKSKGWIPRKGSASFQPSDVSPPQTASSINAPPTRAPFQNFNDMLDPALDGPPSPGRLRAVANQVRKNSVADKHDSQYTNSSGSSSDRPSWEHGIESLTLSRRSSQRSTTSSMPSRERPESAQIFSKSLFNRRGKGRRESGDLGSSNASLSSTEAAAEAAAANGQKEGSSLKSLLRRKTGKDEEASQTKIKISGPYNFQHVAHTDKESDSQPTRQGIDLAQDPARRPRKSSLMGGPPVSYHSHYPSSSSFTSQQDPSAGPHVAHGSSYGEPNEMRHVSPVPAVPSRSVKRTQSQDQFRVPPPRPPRSPTEYNFESPISPPPRTSSRQSARPDSSNGYSSFSSERFAPGAGIRIPQPIVFPSSWDMSNQRDQPRGGISTIDEDDVAPHEQRFSHAITTSDDASWPLPAETITNVLPDVPEEEESHGLSRSHMSMTSNSSALRGSVSVPLLRHITQPQGAPNARPPSGASETLGRFDLLAAQRALRASMDDDASVYSDELDQDEDNWEDDIDYCYEHAAEADCDYAWERPSMDMARDVPQSQMEIMGFRYPNYGSEPSGLLSPPGRDDVPALSPVSQMSNGTNEAKTPTVVLPITSNFSLPRRDSSAVLVRSHSHSRNVSHADSFKEAASFDLSPSLLIPGDYHQQMLLHERGELREEDEDYLVAPLSPSGTHFAQSSKNKFARSSASTTDSIFSNRHKSTASTSTTLTRWTSTSTSNALIEGWQPEDRDFEKTAISPLPEFEVSDFRRDTSAERHARAQSHANFLVKSGSETNMADHIKSGPETIKTRRRAKTTSRSHNTPPVSFGLFPTAPNNRI